MTEIYSFSATGGYQPALKLLAKLVSLRIHPSVLSIGPSCTVCYVQNKNRMCRHAILNHKNGPVLKIKKLVTLAISSQTTVRFMKNAEK